MIKDFDRFKRFNGSYGHRVEDEVPKFVGRVKKSKLKFPDILPR